MPHQIFQIDELLRLVINELVKTSPRTAVSFALARRSFEQPTLGSLWRRQYSLTILVKVLSNHTWGRDKHGNESIAIEHDPSPEDWARLRRYASWMRLLNLDSDESFTGDTFSQLSCNSPGGVLCPKLEHLLWDVGEADIPPEIFRLFLSPNLESVSLYDVSSLVPLDQLEPLAQMISLLPTSLRNLVLIWGDTGEFFQDAISSFVHQRGSSLRGLYANISLPETAIHHLMQLPNLRQWTIYQGPPRVIPTSIFPSLEDLRLREPVALPWLHILASHGKGTAHATAASHANIRETLKSLHCPSGTTIESTLLYSVIKFQNLTKLYMDTYCFNAGSCIFLLTDGDMENLAAALPRLESLRLGRPCRFNSCNTTIASLLSLSVRCLGLTDLETHFNTQAIVSDIRHLLDEGVGHDKAKCMVSELSVGKLPPIVCKEDVENVAMGLKVIFPRLRKVWDEDGILSPLTYEIED